MYGSYSTEWQEDYRVFAGCTCRTEWCIYFTCGKYRKLLTKQILNCVVVRMLRHKARYETKLRFMMSFERLFL
jgi:hypothetical protein